MKSLKPKYIKQGEIRAKMKVIMAAAGTAGHINPALAIANKIKKENPSAEITFIGTERGLEQDLVPRAGYPLRTIDAYGLSKKLSLDNLKKMIKTLKGIFEARKIVKEIKPDLIIGTGGYICGAVILAGHKYKIPTMLHESNAFPGKAVKMLAPKTDVIMVSFKDALARITNAKKVVLTGTPTRDIKQNMTLDEKIKEIEKYSLNPAKPTVLVFGGSQGAKAINDAIIDLAEKKLNKKYQILLVSGPKQYEIVKEEFKKKNLDIDNIYGIKVVPYIYDMVEIMNSADILVCRSGATTITEIAKLGKPSILIPLPNVSHDHQQYNAEVLENVGSAFIIKNNELTAEDLNGKIEQMLDKNLLETMGNNARKASIDNVEDRIYDEIKKVLGI